MQNLKPFLASITKTDTATTVAASVMMTVCTLAMFLTWGLLAAAAVLQPQVKIAGVPPDPCTTRDDCAFQIADADRFNQLLVNDQFDRFLLRSRGPLVRVLVPRSSAVAAFCQPFRDQGSPCLDRPLFFSAAGANDPRPLLEQFYPTVFGPEAMSRSRWNDIRFNAEQRVYYDCVLQQLRQHGGEYGFECLSWRNESLPLAEVTDIYGQVAAAFGAGSLSYAPDGKRVARINEVRGWPLPGFPILYDLLALETIATAQQLEQLTGYDLTEQRLMYIVPRASNVDGFCRPFEQQGIACLRVPLYASTVLGNDHTAFFQVLYPELAGVNIFDLIRQAGGPYHFGSIWQEGLDTGFYRFTTSRLEGIFSYDEIRETYQALSRTFSVGPLRYVPAAGDQEQAARGWANPAFPIIFSDRAAAVDYEAYTTGVAYGYVRRFQRDDFAAASRAGRVNWRDLVVIDEAPFDAEATFSGIVTGTVQDPLSSHLSLRTANRGVPNGFVRDAYAVFAPWQDQLVRLALAPDGYTVNPATVAEAEQHWAAIRPELEPPRPVNRTEQRLLNLLTMDDEPTSRFSRYGSKAANLSVLYQEVLPAENQLFGFGVPFAYFFEFMEDPQNVISDYTQGNSPSTYAQYYRNLLADSAFRSDPVLRAEKLDELRQRIERSGRVKAELVDQLVTRVREIWELNDRGQDGSGRYVAVRFRSSGNMEDSLEFNGAGLYSSTGVCLGDQLDGNTSGPSRCYSDEDDERTVERGLKRVWASVFNGRAFDERDYFGLPQAAVAMAVLVNTASAEDANAVAFTGYPHRVQINPDVVDYVVNAQAGELEVVNPDPDVRAEVDIIRVSRGRDQVLDVFRAQRSSELAAPAVVLSNEQLVEIGDTLRRIDERFLIDPLEYPDRNIIRDTELKYLGGRLIYKQVRPFRIGPVVRRSFSRDLPLAPEQLPAAANVGVLLTWSSPPTALNQVLIERSEADGEFVLHDTLGPQARQYQDQSVQAGSVYHYRIRNENGNGVSPPSNVVTVTAGAASAFRRGDANADGDLNLTDAIFTLNGLFLGGPQPPCADAADADDSGTLNLTDAVFSLNYLFQSGPVPPEPGPTTPRPDPTEDALSCAQYQ